MTKLCRESVWLIFETPDDASRFLNIVYRESDPEKLRDHMQGYGRRQSYAWNWRIHTEYVNHKNCFFAGVVFPQAHLDLVVQRVLEHSNT